MQARLFVLVFVPRSNLFLHTRWHICRIFTGCCVVPGRRSLSCLVIPCRNSQPGTGIRKYGGGRCCSRAGIVVVGTSVGHARRSWLRLSLPFAHVGIGICVAQTRGLLPTTIIFRTTSYFFFASVCSPMMSYLTPAVGPRCPSSPPPPPAHGTVSALSIFMDVRRTDRKASLASVAGELEMEEQGDGAKLLKSKASARRQSLAYFSFTQACRTVDIFLRRGCFRAGLSARDKTKLYVCKVHHETIAV